MSTVSQPLVSVVTPVYNEAKHLAECVESILAQTYQNWDYTIVDNCSTDGTLDIALAYAAKDKRIRVQRNERFLPAIPNHNVAMRQISPESKYCKVVLGDDWIFPECIQQMVKLAEENPSIGIVGAYALEGCEVHWAGLPYTSRVVPGREICRKHFLDSLYVFGSATSVLYRADLVRSQDPFFNEANIHADTEACFQLLKTSDFGFVHQVLTYTRVREGSLTSISKELNTYYAHTLHILLSHGQHYLTEEETKNCLDLNLRSYYRFLGKSLISRRNKSFWDAHKRQLVELGLGFSWARVAVGTAATLFAAALNPKNSVTNLRKRQTAT